MVTLDLTINTPASGTDVITACGSYTWIDGTTYTSSTNTATTTLTASNGCDSVVTLDLTINTNLTGTDIITTCGSYTWIDGTTYTSSNYVATDTLTSLGGCDSIVYLNLTIVPNISTTDQIAACGSYTWINGITYTSSNYSDTVVLSSQSGCDSVITLDLTINPPYTGTDVITACESYTWIDGNTYTASNNSATHLLTGANGCDSTVTLNLTINNTSTGTDVISACGSYTWIDGTTYTSSTNTATTILTASNGCDSVVTLDLTINTPASGTDVITACGSYTWIDGTTYTSSTNTATTILTASNGCDSIVTLDLTINSPVTSTEVVTACGSYTWIDGNTYTSSDTSASITFTASNGCDSAVNLDLTIIPPANSVDSVTACGSYTWIDGNTYTSNNSTAIDTLIGSNGCDSIVTLNLVITNTFSTTEVISACVSYTWINGITYTSSNTDSVLLIASNGCDSILYLNLTILQSKSSIDSVQACNSFTWINGVTYLSDNNNASVTYTAQNGCDSVVYLDLTISNINTAVQASGDTLVAPPNQTFYQWMRCETGSYSPIAGATSNTFTPTSKGQYAVRIVNGACTDTSSCVFFSGLGMNESKLSIKIYPNPSKGILNIKSDILFIGIKIYDSSGREVFDSKIEQPSEELSLNLENLKSGFYSIQLIGEERVYSETLIISY